MRLSISVLIANISSSVLRIGHTHRTPYLCKLLSLSKPLCSRSFLICV